MLLAHHISIGPTLSLLLFSAGIGLLVADVRARERNEKQVELQWAAYELGRTVERRRARRTLVSA